MTITYTATDGATTLICGFRASGPSFGDYTYDTRRAYLKFDLSGEGIGGIETAELILVATSITGGGDDVVLASATGGSGWGATLDSTQADFVSTNTHVEDTVAVNTTGTYTFNIDPAHIDTAGTTYFRLKLHEEGASAPYSKQVQFASQDHGTPASRPILRLMLFTGQVIFINAF